MFSSGTYRVNFAIKLSFHATISLIIVNIDLRLKTETLIYFKRLRRQTTTFYLFKDNIFVIVLDFDWVNKGQSSSTNVFHSIQIYG